MDAIDIEFLLPFNISRARDKISADAERAVNENYNL